MHAIGNDLLLYLLTANEYKNFAYISKPLNSFRLHNDSISLSAENGKLSFFYNLTKIYFVENYRNDLIRLQNLQLFLYLKKNQFHNNFGIKNISDFYDKNNDFSIMSLHCLSTIKNKNIKYNKKIINISVDGQLHNAS